MDEQHDITNLMLGAGVLFLDLLEDGVHTGEVDLGDVSELTTTPEVENREHYSSRTADRRLLRDVPIRTKLGLSATGHEFNRFNAALITAGKSDTLTQASATVTAEPLTAKVKKGRWFPTAKREISSVVVRQGATVLSPVNDYEVDTVSGRIRFLPGGAAVEDAAAEVDYSAAVIAGLDMVSVGAQPKKEGRIRYKSDPSAGPVVELILWRVSTRPDGALAFISDDYGNWSLNMTVQDDSANHPDHPYGQLIYLGESR